MLRPPPIRLELAGQHQTLRARPDGGGAEAALALCSGLSRA